MTIAIDLHGRIALVTGAGGGIGAGIVAALLEAGAHVVAADLKSANLDDLPDHSALERIELDVTDDRSVADTVDWLARTRRLHVVVNNAGVASRVGMPFTRLDAADWQLPWDVNVVGTFLVSKAAVPHLRATGGGSIVNIASVSGRTGFQTSPPYSASKAAVINFTQAMARDLAAASIRVNAVCPGMVFTQFYRSQRLETAVVDPSVAELTDEEFFEEKARRLIPLGRGQTPADIGAAVAFLSSDLAASVTGQALNVDGGLVMS
jgi:2-hydroxycyclohexanecarboxyl-CoA dehydrogenase